jgi:hypothetical protein
MGSPKERQTTMRGKLGWFIAVGGISLLLLAEARAQQGGGGGAGVGTGGGIGTGGGVGSGGGIGTGGGIGNGGGSAGGRGGAGGMAGGAAGMSDAFQGGGGGYLGQLPATTTTNVKGAGTAPGIPAESNPLKGSFADPLSFGLKAGAKGTFGQPLYPTTANTARTTATKKAATKSNTIVGFNTFGQQRDVPYATDLGEDMPVIVREATRLENNLRGVVLRSSALPSKGNVKLAVESGAVVLRGQVATPREKRLVEDMLRLEPGVREVRNELTIGR